MKVRERTPDDLDRFEMDAILRSYPPTKVPPLTEYEEFENQMLLRRRIEAQGRGRAAPRC